LCIATLGWNLPLHRFLDRVTRKIYSNDLWRGPLNRFDGIFGLVIALV
jgi:hypothetical protein